LFQDVISQRNHLPCGKSSITIEPEVWQRQTAGNCGTQSQRSNDVSASMTAGLPDTQVTLKSPVCSSTAMPLAAGSPFFWNL